MALNLDRCLADLKKGNFLKERDLKHLCVYVKDILAEESNVQTVRSPVTVRKGCL